MLGLKVNREQIITKFKSIDFWNIIIIALILSDIILLMLITFYNVNPTLYRIIAYFDLFVCFMLFIDFIIRMREAENKWDFIKRNWIDIIAMMPVDIFGPFASNYVGYLRLIRIVRILALFKTQLNHLFKFFKETHLDIAIGMLLFSVFSGTVLFYILEAGKNSNVRSLLDSFWYAITTTVTGGSDITPETTYGRLLAVVLMLIGVTFVGMLTASIASWLIKRSQDEEGNSLESKLTDIENSMENIKSEMEELKSLIKKLEK